MESLREIVSDCLGCEPDSVVPNANFFHDLEGESIDVLDLTFRCEKRFGVRLPLQAMIERDLWEFDANGRLSANSHARLKTLLPNLDLASLVNRPDGFNPRDILTIDTIATLILRGGSCDATIPAVS